MINIFNEIRLLTQPFQYIIDSSEYYLIEKITELSQPVHGLNRQIEEIHKRFTYLTIHINGNIITDTVLEEKSNPHNWDLTIWWMITLDSAFTSHSKVIELTLKQFESSLTLVNNF